MQAHHSLKSLYDEGAFKPPAGELLVGSLRRTDAVNADTVISAPEPGRLHVRIPIFKKEKM